MHSQMFMRY
nr:unnamed protein product [Callosobruchus analis]